MGCVCCSLSSFISIVLDALERISLCTVCALLTCCLLFTIISVMVLGIGIGYHYCFVQNSVDSMAKAAKAAGATRSGPERSGGLSPNMMRSMGKAMSRGFGYRSRERRELKLPPGWRNQQANVTHINGTFTNGSLYNNTYYYDDYDNETSFNDSLLDNQTVLENEKKTNAANYIAQVYHILRNITRY